MKQLPALLILLALTAFANAQIKPFGKIDTADLKMTFCDFEKDANAEILFDKGVMSLSGGLNMEHHIRIKIFNDFGKNAAKILLVSSVGGQKVISDLQGETFNLENGKIEITTLDNKQTLAGQIGKKLSTLEFTLPNVKPGSVIEYKFKSPPTEFWYFQNDLPTRYSEIETDYLARAGMGYITYVKQPYAKNTGKNTGDIEVKALANIHSLTTEPYMASRRDNLERIRFFNLTRMDSSWSAAGKALLQFRLFSDELTGALTGENAIIKRGKALKSEDERISFLFDTVKNRMKWNGISSIHILDGAPFAWDKTIGNSAEINLAVYYLLKRAGIKAFPLLVSTRSNGKISPTIPNIDVLNNLVVYVPVDSTKSYILDATDKFNTFNVIPFDDLNFYGLSIDQEAAECKLIQVQDAFPEVQSVFLNAEITPEAKISGTVEITSDHYNKINALKKYKRDGEAKYIDSLRKGDDNIKITSFKMENAEADTLPLSQKIDFNAVLVSSDKNYIYFNTNLFSFMEDNPFKSENRFSDIDFGYRNNYSISGIYKLPQGYKTDALPKNVTIIMPDQSIVFKRIMAEDNGTIVARYTIDHRKTIYLPEEYQNVHDFYKKMYELLNEQIVLKKS